MATYADIIAEARVLLQDTVSPYRYSDAELLVGANDAVKIIRKVRPDIFLGQFSTAIADAILSTTFPIGLEYKKTVRDFVVAHGQLRDSEDVIATKAAMFIQMFKESLTAL
jgi:hypothetical protein